MSLLPPSSDDWVALTDTPLDLQQAAYESVYAPTDNTLSGLKEMGKTYLDPAKGWGGFGFYFLEDRAAAYAKHPDDPDHLAEALHRRRCPQHSQHCFTATGEFDDRIQADHRPGNQAF